jgi:hypothetical protein
MTITVTNKISNLKPYNVHEGEEIKFQITRKGRPSDVWFSGKNNNIRNIYFGNLNLVSLGKMDSKTEKEIIGLMMAGKTDILTDGHKFYTRASIGFCRIENIDKYIYSNPYLQ